MAERPIILQGSERLSSAEGTNDSAFDFDGKLGMWRDRQGRLAIQVSDSPETLVTNTREGIDPSEGSYFCTHVTKTREGVDQSDRSH
jgi:hypothetical protein